MTRYTNILSDIQDNLVEGAQKTYDGTKRSDLKDSDFLFPETRSFPIVTPQDIPDAISNFGRMKSTMSYDSFLKKLYNMAKRKGPAFVAAFPDASKEKLGIKKKVSNKYQNNDTQDDITEDDLSYVEYDEMASVDEPSELESPETELMDYKNDFYEMSLGSIKSIAVHAQQILNAIENGSESVKEGLTESWLQGKIAVTEDYLLTIHNFLMFGESETDTESTDAAKDLPGLWENIRKKRERMGKKYKPAKPGDKGRPDPEQWKKLTKKK